MYYDNSVFVFSFFVAVFIVFLIWLFGSVLAKKHKGKKLDNGLELVEYSSKYSVTKSMQYVTGRVKNISKSTCSVSLTIVIRNNRKETIGTLNDFIKILKPNEIWTFETYSIEPFSFYEVYLERM